MQEAEKRGLLKDIGLAWDSLNQSLSVERFKLVPLSYFFIYLAVIFLILSFPYYAGNIKINETILLIVSIAFSVISSVLLFLSVASRQMNSNDDGSLYI